MKFYRRTNPLFEFDIFKEPFGDICLFISIFRFAKLWTIYKGNQQWKFTPPDVKKEDVSDLPRESRSDGGEA